MKKIVGLLLLVALAVPGMALAQQQGDPEAQGGPPRGSQGGMRQRMPGPPGSDEQEMMRSHERMFGSWWKDSELAKQIELTPEQIKQIEQKFIDSRLKLIDERADLERQETLLQPMMEEDRPDEARVGAQLDKVVAARGRLEKENAMMMLSIRRVLTVDQWKKLQAIQHERERGAMMRMRQGGERGPGGMGRRPGQPTPPKRPEGPETPNGPGV
jgi:Spy/CpxP family protein refolding chaperone